MRFFVALLTAIAIAAQPNSNWSTPWIVLQAPAAYYTAKAGFRGLIIGKTALDPQDTAYVSTQQGTAKALISCIASDPTTADDRGCWSDISTGISTTTGNGGPLFYAATLRISGNKLWGVFRNGFSNTAGSDVGFWNGSTWVNQSVTPADWSLEGMDHLDIDGSGNIYVAGAGGRLFVSRDAGSTYSQEASWVGYGYAGGATFGLDIWGAFLYWGGESPLIRIPLADLTQNCNVLSGGTGSEHAAKNFACTVLDTHQYAHNMRGTLADGGPGTAPAAEVLAFIDDIDAGGGSYLQRYNVPTNLWARPPVATVTGCTALNTTGWFYYKGNQGYTAHEYYIGTGLAGDCYAAIGSIDGGRTWQQVGTGIPSCNHSGCEFNSIAVSSTDDSKIAGSQGSLSNNASFIPVLYFHPSPGPLTSTAGMVTNSGIVIGPGITFK